MKRTIILFLFLVMVNFPGFNQIEYSKISPGPIMRAHPGVRYVTIGGDTVYTTLMNLRNTQRYRQGYKVDVAGVSFNVDLSPKNSGEWETHPDGSSVWRLGLTSKNARALNLVLYPFYLEKGCRLIVYSPDLTSISGAYTFRNNRDNNLLALSPVQDDSLIIELQVASYLRDFGHLVISKIGVEPKENKGEKSATDKWYGTSASCEIDINCNTDHKIQTQKHAIQRIIITANGKVIRCSGTLLNNTSEDGRTLFLTAGHCIDDNFSASTSVIYFDYESPYCEGPDGPIKSISGGKLLSRDDRLDFALLEFSEKPPFYYNPLYSGWDAQENTLDTTYTIHHPEGDVKKLTINYDPEADSIISGYDPVKKEYIYWKVPDNLWLIRNYELGSTEDGSSGSGLLDNNFRVVGTLSSGGAPCSDIIDDYYSRFSHEWADSSEISMQLRHWLDPDSTGKLVLDNFVPFQNLDKISQTLTNISPDETPTLKSVSGNWGYISGHNSLHQENFAEKFSVNGSKYISSVSLDVAKSIGFTDSSKIRLKISEGDPLNIIYRKEVYLFELTNGLETSVQLDSQIFVSNIFYVGYEVFYGSPQDTFALYTGKEFSDAGQNTAFVLENNSWSPLNDGVTTYYTSLDIKLHVLNYHVKKGSDPAIYPYGEITMYPNPAVENLQLLFKNLDKTDVQIQIFSLSGELVYYETRVQPEPNFGIDISRFDPGVYIIKAWTDKLTYNGKFIKL